MMVTVLLIGLVWGALLAAVGMRLWFRPDPPVVHEAVPYVGRSVSWGMPEDYPTWEWPRTPGPVLTATVGGVDRPVGYGLKVGDLIAGPHDVWRVTAPNGRTALLARGGVASKHKPHRWEGGETRGTGRVVEFTAAYPDAPVRGPIS